MILHPTVIIGLGTTGKQVVAGVERYLYEVLNGEGLDLFRFLILETAINQAEQDAMPGSGRTKPVDIKVQDVGAAFFAMKQVLQSDFDWCPAGMHIDGPGAGNKRAGGRLMLLYNMAKIEKMISTAISEVSDAARDDKTTARIMQLLAQRDAQPTQNLLPAVPVPVIMVVGTLAGGTCSGGCTDLGYIIRRIAPTSYREAVLLLPDKTAAPKFRANAWAALCDLGYFTEHPEDYRVSWVTEDQNRSSYDEADTAAEPPYQHIYLVTERDRAGNMHLSYREDASGCPLLTMAALSITANLLGLQELRRERLANHIEPNRIHQTFLTQSIRGVSYPKYEISNAAACQIICHLCSSWLSRDVSLVDGRSEQLQKDEVAGRGREVWNTKVPAIWAGLRSAIDAHELAARIKSGKIASVSEYLLAQITEDKQDTLYRKVSQNVENRRRELENMIRLAAVEVLQQKQNITYTEWFLDGLQAELRRATKYWTDVGVPGAGDAVAWKQRARELVARMESRFNSTSANLFGQRLDVIEDEVGQIITRLEMFLMYDTMDAVTKWIETELRSKLGDLEQLLQSLNAFASSQAESIKSGLRDNTGPLLKVSRSPDRRFDDEIAALEQVDPGIAGKEFIAYDNGKFTGMFPIADRIPRDAMAHLFLVLLDRVQPILIRQLQKEGPIDIANEIERQGVIPQTVQRALATQQLSLPVQGQFMAGPGNTIPSLLLSKTAQLSTRLHQRLRASDAGFPGLIDQELPFFDHMALFYQEGTKFTMDSLSWRGDFEKAHAQGRADDAETLNPLRRLKEKGDLCTGRAEAAGKGEDGASPRQRTAPGTAAKTD